MWTSHDAFFDQRCDTKCKDWKQDWSRHLYTHCLSALLFILYPVSQTSLVSPGLDHWLRWSQDCYRSKVCWWYFIPEIWRVENQSRWKKDSCFVAHRSLGCKWKQNKKVKRWRGGEDAWKKGKYLGSTLDTEEDIKRRKGQLIHTRNSNLLSAASMSVTKSR